MGRSREGEEGVERGGRGEGKDWAVRRGDGEEGEGGDEGAVGQATEAAEHMA